MPRTRRAAPLQFLGETQSVEGPVPDGWPTTGVLIGVELDTPATEATAGFITLSGGRGHGLRIMLPGATPPGSYEGAVVLGEDRRKIVAEVLAARLLTLAPSPLEIEGAPGEEVERSLIATNAGNVAIELPGREFVGLFAQQGLARSLGAAFTSDSARGVDRLGALADDLAASHGGLLRLTVTEGAGLLEPLERRRLSVRLRVPTDAEPGRSYFGYARLAAGTVTIRCHIVSHKEEE